MRHVIAILVLLTTNTIEAADFYPRNTGRLHDLVYGEIRFLSRQNDYSSAISRLLLARQEGLLPQDHKGVAFLLANLLLGYGLHDTAGALLFDMLAGDIPDLTRNQAWYELARMLFYKGYTQAAKESLDRITGSVPAPIRGDYRLLRAYVLMALGLNEQAASELEEWQGPPEQAGYAAYNRGVALTRTGNYDAAIRALLEAIAAIDAEGEELFALKDKANLVLGYAFLEIAEPERAQACFERVRLRGPFSNRALLGAGWAAWKQGHGRVALTPWMELRRRSIIDPAVQEAYLTVPAVQRELQSLTVAARFYEEAITSFSQELQRLHAAIEWLQTGDVIQFVHDKEPAPSPDFSSERETIDVASPGRYLGRLLAGHNFQEAVRGYRDLFILRETLEHWLRRLSALDGLPEIPVHRDRLPVVGAPSPQNRTRDTSASSEQRRHFGAKEGTVLPAGPAWMEGWEHTARQGNPSSRRSGSPLPEVALPPEEAIAPFPKSRIRWLPSSSEVIWLPSEPEVLWLPGDPQIIWLPQSEIVWLPKAAGVQLPQTYDAALPHPAFAVPPAPLPAERSETRRVLRAIPQANTALGVRANPLDEDMLRDLREAIDRPERGIGVVGRGDRGPSSGAEGFAERIAALRARILALRPRIAKAIEAHRSYVRTLALQELARHQRLLEEYLQTARLELAKTYDLSGSR